METLKTDPDFTIYLHEPEEPVLASEIEERTRRKFIGQVIPTACHVLPEGSPDDKPSICFELEDGKGLIMVAQITKAMLQPVWEAMIKMEQKNCKHKWCDACSHGCTQICEHCDQEIDQDGEVLE